MTSPDTMTDAELIEAVATRVMGWKKNAADYWEKDGEIQADAFWDVHDGRTDPWNPLSDWNHTMEVMKAAGEEYGDAFYAAWEESEPAEIWSRSSQRAICLAALQAIQ